jgi:hypothetical protein
VLHSVFENLWFPLKINFHFSLGNAILFINIIGWYEARIRKANNSLDRRENRKCAETTY